MEQTPCLLCGADDARPILNRQEPRHVVCQRCGLVYQNPRPTREGMNAYYERDYWELYERGYSAAYVGKHRHKFAERADAIVAWLRPYVKPADFVLEIGCGHGSNLAELRHQLGCQVLGIEPSTGQAAAARERFGLDVIASDLDSVELGDRRAKVIVLSHVLEHFHDPRWALRRCRGWLESGGLMFIEVPNALRPNPAKRLSNWLAVEHMTYFSPGTLRRILEEESLEILRIEAATYVRVLVRALDQPKIVSPVPREASRVRRAMRLHELRYWPAYVIKRLWQAVASRVRPGGD